MTPSPGVRITAIIRKPVLCRLLLTGNVRTANLIIRVVKKTARELVVNKVMSTLVLPDGFMLPQTAVPGIILTVNAAPLLLLPDVRPIIRLPVIRHADHPVLIPVVIPATAVVMITVRPVLLKIIPVLMLLQLNAGQDVTDVKTVLQAVPLTPALTLDLLNAVLVINVMTTVNPVRSPYLVLLLM